MSDYICTDLIVHIFERLPPRSIVRFRSLSKYWHLLSPEFLHDHRLQCIKNPPKVLIRHLTYCDSDYEFRDIYTLHYRDQLPLDPGSGYVGIPGVSFPFSDRTSDLIGSCSGIICLREKDNISLWNFSVRHKLIVPRHPCLEFSFKCPEVALGFGFDTITDDYKVVGISYSKSVLDRNDVFIYSLKTDCWRAVTSSFALPAKHRLLKACFFNGVSHWVVVREDNSYYILTFNLSTHVFGYILLPRCRKVRQLTTVNDCLAVVSWEGGDYWKIRTMEVYDNVESWSVLYEFKAEVFDVIRVFQPVTNGDILAYYDGSWVYNLKTRMLTELSKFGHDCFSLEMETYVESFELLDNERATTCGQTIFSWAKKDNHKRIRFSQRRKGNMVKIWVCPNES